MNNREKIICNCAKYFFTRLYVNLSSGKFSNPFVFLKSICLPETYLSFYIDQTNNCCLHEEMQLSTVHLNPLQSIESGIYKLLRLTAVATRMGHLAERNSLRACSRSICDRSPWILLTQYPSLDKKYSRVSAPFFVSTNISVNDSAPETSVKT